MAQDDRSESSLELTLCFKFKKNFPQNQTYLLLIIIKAISLRLCLTEYLGFF